MSSCKLSKLPDFLNNIMQKNSQKYNFAEPFCLVAVESLSSKYSHINQSNIFSDDVLDYIKTTQTHHTSHKPYYPLENFTSSGRLISDKIAFSLSEAISLTQHFSSYLEAEDFKKYVRYATSEIINCPVSPRYGCLAF